MRFKNAELNALVAGISNYGNLVINDISDVKTEKERTDGACSRKYYVAYPQSTDNITAARGVTMWQDHNSDRTSSVWKKAPNPARLRRLIDAGEDCKIAGFVSKVELTQPYLVNDREVTTTTLYVSHIDELEKELTRFLVDAGLLEKEVATA